MCRHLADAQGELRADCDIRKKGDIDLRWTWGPEKKQKLRHEKIQFFKVF